MAFDERIAETAEFQRIAARAYIKDPRRTDADLRALGCPSMATFLEHDYKIGRLQENLDTTEP